MHFVGGFADHNLKNLSFFIDKHNGYATREAADVLNQRYDLFPRDGAVNAGSSTRQAGLRRLNKERFYNRIPFPLSSLGYFLFRYIFQLGFLDGREGVIYHGLQAFWYRFLVGAKVLELERAISTCPTARRACKDWPNSPASGWRVRPNSQGRVERAVTSESASRCG